MKRVLEWLGVVFIYIPIMCCWLVCRWIKREWNASFGKRNSERSDRQ